MGRVIAALLVLEIFWFSYTVGHDQGRLDEQRARCTQSGGVPVTQLHNRASTVYCQPRPDWDKN